MLLCLTATLFVAFYVAYLWGFLRGVGQEVRSAPFVEPPTLPAPNLGRVAMYRVEERGGRFEIVDDQGRVVLLRGVHLVAMKPPFRPVALGDEATFRALGGLGFNAIRLMVPWEALEPQPRTVSLEHLQYLRWFLDTANKYGFVVVVDSSLVSGSRCFGGAGAPMWAHRPGFFGQTRLGSECAGAGIPTGLRMLRWWADFYDNTWTVDGLSFQDHLIWSFTKVAEVLQHHPALLGYGVAFGMACSREGLMAALYPGRAECDVALSDFLRRFSGAIRAIDWDALIFLDEPVGFGAGTEGSFARAPALKGIVWSARIQGVNGCKLEAFERLQKRANDAGAALVVSQMSWPKKADEALHLMSDIEAARASVFFWYYSTADCIRCGDIEGYCDEENLFLSEEHGGASAGIRCTAFHLVRPYPMRVGGSDWLYRLNRKWSARGNDKHLGSLPEDDDSFELEVWPGSSFAETLVFVPRNSFYGEDPSTEAPEFVVEVSSGVWHWSEKNKDILRWLPDFSKVGHVLRIRTWGGKRASGLLEGCKVRE